MLSNEHRTLVKATVPLLETGGETLTQHFYKMMLSEYPEVRPLFNQAHQASGDQPRALANGVLMYARHIDELEQVGPLVAKIVNKHVALQIQPEHYPIVGSCLLRAIREVLGEEIATDAVIDAWAAAYGQLAEILIGAEESVYQQNAEQVGGWRGARRFRIARKEVESEEITSFYFQPLDGEPLLDFQPGQYIGLSLEIGGEEMRRTYSLSDSPNGREYRISVKREPEGKVSNYLHDRLNVGDELDLFPPAGDFVLRGGDKPLALITAGVGITPALAMLKPALESGREVHFIHCARHGGAHAFREWVEAQSEAHPQLKHYFCYSEPRAQDASHVEGFLSRELLADWLPQDRDLDAYFLGPKPFMAQVKRHLREIGVPEQQSHYEFFGPASALEA